MSSFRTEAKAKSRLTQLLAIWLLLLAFIALPALGNEEHGGELYTSRPDVLSKQVKKIKSPRGAPDNWFGFKEGTFNFLAELVALYPKDDIYFLARDGEYLYDMARVLYKNDPQMLKRLKLINISTALSSDSNLDKFLKQEGLSAAGLKGKGAVLVDTCCSGSIPEAVRNNLTKLRSKLKSHFISSSSDHTPSSRVFLEAYHPEEYWDSHIKTPGNGDVGLEVEGYPHYTESMNRFAESKDGKLVPANQNYNPNKENQNVSRGMMGNIKQEFDTAKVRKDFQDRVKLMRDVADVAAGKKVSQATFDELMTKLGKAEATHLPHDIYESASAGWFDGASQSAVEKNFLKYGYDVKDDFNTLLSFSSDAVKKKAMKLLNDTPELRSILAADPKAIGRLRWPEHKWLFKELLGQSDDDITNRVLLAALENETAFKPKVTSEIVNLWLSDRDEDAIQNLWNWLDESEIFGDRVKNPKFVQRIFEIGRNIDDRYAGYDIAMAAAKEKRLPLTFRGRLVAEVMKDTLSGKQVIDEEDRIRRLLDRGFRTLGPQKTDAFQLKLFQTSKGETRDAVVEHFKSRINRQSGLDRPLDQKTATALFAQLLEDKNLKKNHNMRFIENLLGSGELKKYPGAYKLVENKFKKSPQKLPNCSYYFEHLR